MYLNKILLEPDYRKCVGFGLGSVGTQSSLILYETISASSLFYWDAKFRNSHNTRIEHGPFQNKITPSLYQPTFGREKKIK